MRLLELRQLPSRQQLLRWLLLLLGMCRQHRRQQGWQLQQQRH
jgi:hypothetical protein